jgi:uncharacterized protein
MSFESSPATANTSRSSSPVTPEPLESVAVRSDFDHTNSWYIPTMHQSVSLWDIDAADFISPTKTEDHQMLRLDDLIEQHAYEEYVLNVPSISEPLSQFLLNSSPSLSFPSALPYPSSLQLNHSTHSAELLVSNFRPMPNSPTKPIPPPASFPRKHDPSSINQRVVCPPKESCFKSVTSLTFFFFLHLLIIIT